MYEDGGEAAHEELVHVVACDVGLQFAELQAGCAHLQQDDAVGGVEQLHYGEEAAHDHLPAQLHVLVLQEGHEDAAEVHQSPHDGCILRPVEDTAQHEGEG
jgi:hypothetical protein